MSVLIEDFIPVVKYNGFNTAKTVNLTGTFQLGGTAVTSTAAELNILDGVTATGTEINSVVDGNTATAAEITRVCDKSNSVVAVTDATLTVTEASHGDRVVVLNRAAGVTVTLPAASGTGNKYTFIVGTAVTSNADIVKVANATDVFEGSAIGVDDDAEGATGYQWNAETGDDTISLDGTASGGKLGDRIEIVDYASGKFAITAFITQSGGSEATPFSATVS